MKQADLLKKVIEILEGLNVPYMVVGSIASGAYGEPRMTQDIDVVVDLRPKLVDQLCAAFPSEEFYVSREMITEAIRERGQFNVIHPTSGNKIDFMIAHQDSWGRTQLSRRRRMQILPGHEGFTASPEDIIIGKMIYYREGGSEKHLRDITGILKISGADIDQNYIAHWAGELGLMEIWREVLKRIKANL